MNKIGFGGGCHWCTEAVFQSLKGVKTVQQGWISSTEPHSSYSEAVIVEYDPKTIQLEILISIHLYTHSCTSGHSMRSKYRSAIYTFDESDVQVIRSILKSKQPEFEEPIITLVIPFVQFKENEESFQNYYFKNPEKKFCKTYIKPKFLQLMKEFSTHLDEEKLKHLDMYK